MGDRPGSFFRVRTSKDKVYRKDLCWSVRAAYILDKLARCKRARPREGGMLHNGIHGFTDEDVGFSKRVGM